LNKAYLKLSESCKVNDTYFYDKEKNTKEREIITKPKYNVLFPLIILSPSKGKNGIKLNKANHELIVNPYNAIFWIKSKGKKLVSKKITEIKIFINGPDAAIKAYFFLST
jgi:hypothetical protein